MLIDNLKNEIRVFDSMIQAFRGLESAVLNRQTDMLSRYAVTIEELSLEISRLEDERDVILKKMGYQSVKDYIDKSTASDAPQIAYLAAEIVEKLNELTIVMNSIRQIFEFENNYFEFLNNLVRGVNPSPNYSFNQNKQGVSAYTTNYNTSRYDSLK
ncbi:flagellar biosynthesis protein FlgN [Fervidobacterium pennivorans subsp. shakshaketiis]|uniref:FlgN protein n=1 Tax=Fervidobacterium pennivorans (strain DSM 9078 / Ven5) TaxID=771875 RepID=H9UET9_FERPD|nr:flagellar export chaperone FlgN [Fervidobacterium pennivorans]AFG36032.1 FlgN protein [Fervidobacterium pennivorans DSM 9078]QIV79086.1 flagellar protein FlgN [Fervidobacterium pennivorans subsp. keratinolyticus]